MVPFLTRPGQHPPDHSDEHARAGNVEFFDYDVAKRVVALCWRLPDALPAEPDEQQHRLSQLAINEFILAENVQDDNQLLAEFDDDLQFVIAVIHVLGLSRLLEE